MYICLCHAVTDSDIREAVIGGATDLRELAAETGCATGCGSCLESACEVLHEALAEQSEFLPVLAQGAYPRVSAAE
ncbi:MAG: bacterioferritin-associated ferredoxin [Xanthomonadales bacterium]|nr:bacterioferritin-associated ferredoxin [Xanthomonadales bacterium]